MTQPPLTIGAIVVVEPQGRTANVPPLSDYRSVFGAWAEAEYHCVDVPADRVRVAFWTGQPGSVVLDPWPYTELCMILSGRVAVEDRQGGRIEFGPGQSFVIPKGFAGTWVTLVPSKKVFVAIE
jgi:uncharacterized cupin superfamily protein